MKKLFTIFAIALMLGGLIPTGHVHDENCGYDPETDSGCIYEATPYEGGRFGH